MKWITFLLVLVWLSALDKGGWWWLFAIGGTIGWFSKRKEIQDEAAKSESEAIAEQTSSEDDLAAETATIDRPSHLGKNNDRTAAITEICAHYSGKYYYVGEKIPQKNLEIAVKCYPLPDGDQVLALIDSSPSWITGFAIGLHGVSWREGRSKASSLRWNQIHNLPISVEGALVRVIKFGDTYTVSAMGLSLSNKDILKLLLELQRATETYYKTNTSTSNQNVQPSLIPTTAIELVDINIADFNLLLTLPGIGAAEAKMIGSRQASGAFFESLDDMVEFLHLKPHNAEKLKALVICEMPKNRHHHSQRDRGRVIDY